MIAFEVFAVYNEKKIKEDEMQISARYQAILDLISEIFKDESPADNIINNYLRERKYIGSSDRRFITETVWKIIRNRRKLEFDAGSNVPRKILMTYLKDEDLELIFGAGEYAPEALSKEEKSWIKSLNDEVYPPDVEAECPKWLFDKILDVALLKSLNETASADLRINTKNRQTMIEKLRGEGLFFAPTPYSPIGIRSSERVNLNNCIAYKEGEVEVQDEASQLAAILCDVSEEHKTIDYCAGAGGKSLAIAYLLNNKGKIEAHDIDWHRLEQIKPRLERLNIKNVEPVREITCTDYDRFIIDAPCSGTGTWRRSPDAKYRMSQKKLNELNKIQSELLDIAYQKTKIGGRIIYITCSILRDEDEDIINAFTHRNHKVRHIDLRKLWQRKIDAPYPGTCDKFLRFSPLTTNTDGFFFTVLEKVG